MLIPWLIVALVAGLAIWFGAARMAARAWPGLVAGLALVLVAGGICALIAEIRTGSFLAGIIGALCAILLFIAAGAMVLGALLRRLYEWRCPPLGPPSPGAAPGWWAVLGIGLFSALAVLASALE